jgi:catechol 2,3-dioxygenase-like lactoylglutathione lyase family enzyme
MMQLTMPDHYTIRARDVQETLAFYREVVGLATGPRPPFENPGFWLYAGETPVIHLFSREHRYAYVGRVADEADPERSLAGSGAIDHVAFRAEGGFEEAREHLRALGVSFRELAIPGAAFRQLFLVDPNGLTVEMSFGR